MLSNCAICGQLCRVGAGASPRAAGEAIVSRDRENGKLFGGVVDHIDDPVVTNAVLEAPLPTTPTCLVPAFAGMDRGV